VTHEALVMWRGHNQKAHDRLPGELVFYRDHGEAGSRRVQLVTFAKLPRCQSPIPTLRSHTGPFDRVDRHGGRELDTLLALMFLVPILACLIYLCLHRRVFGG
jgi:hypothetical protein